MTLSQLIIGWFYYGIFYMGGAIVVTIMLNRIVKKYTTAPLLLNAVSIISLLAMVYFRQITNEQFWFHLFFTYMPIVFGSSVCNFILFLIRKGKLLHEEEVL